VEIKGPSYSQEASCDYNPFTELACQVKRKLAPSRHEDPAVRVQVPATNEMFQALTSQAKKDGRVYRIQEYSWHIRVVNQNGDFSYALLETIRFYLAASRPLIEYEPVFEDGAVKTFEPVFIEQCSSLVFSFVRCDGTKAKLSQQL